MKFVFLGDVFGQPGREALEKYIPRIRNHLAPDFLIVNGENAAHGIGITADICNLFFDLGVDVITTGNHVWDQREIISFIDKDDRLIRPANFSSGTVGKGYTIVENSAGKKMGVINVMTQLFMKPIDSPFPALEDALMQMRLADNVDAILVDVHGEASSEKKAIGYFCDGYVSCVVGTHTHVPTADSQILPGGTAYQTDAGMCGCYDSIIGMDKEIALQRMSSDMPSDRMRPAEGEGAVCGIFVITDDETGLATKIQPVRMGPHIEEYLPDVA